MIQNSLLFPFVDIITAPLSYLGNFWINVFIHPWDCKLHEGRSSVCFAFQHLLSPWRVRNGTSWLDEWKGEASPIACPRGRGPTALHPNLLDREVPSKGAGLQLHLQTEPSQGYRPRQAPGDCWPQSPLLAVHWPPREVKGVRYGPQPPEACGEKVHHAESHALGMEWHPRTAIADPRVAWEASGREAHHSCGCEDGYRGISFHHSSYRPCLRVQQPGVWLGAGRSTGAPFCFKENWVPR